MTELKYMIGTIFLCVSVQPPKRNKPVPLDLGDVFGAGVRSGHCWLHFIER